MFERRFFIFVILDLESRVLVHINATLNPTRERVTHQYRNALCDIESCPTLCISDRDSIFAQWLKPTLKNYFGIKLLRIPYKQPWKNGRVERFHRYLKEAAFAEVIPSSLPQVQQLCIEYKSYYNYFRCHQALDGKIPSKTPGPTQLRMIGYQKKSHLFGKITSFNPIYQVAA